MVVPDNAIAEKVPAIAGMMMYQKNNRQLFLKVNKTWNEIAQKKEVNLYIDVLNML